MGKIVAVICEYNPFHNGHKYQIDKIREKIPDATIVCIMSGNATQRGEFALLDKYTRAKVAVLNGANVVLEMPFPFSASNAEIFAFAGVEIASKIGADYLCFGIESKEIAKLEKIVDLICTDEFEIELKAQLENKKNSYIVAREKALKSLGEQITTGSNDILAIEYLRAIRRINPQIKPLPIQRNGCNYNDVEISNMMSASGIREQFYLSEKFLSVPQNALESYEKDAFLGAVVDKERAEQFLYMKILSSSPEQISKAFDAPDGSGYFIYELAKSSVSSNEFFEKLTSKAYTYARLRRVVIYFALGVEKINKEISFAQLLCADKNGRVLLKKIKHEESIKIITKHADSRVLDENELEIYYLDKKIDEIYQGLLSKPQAPNGAYKKNAIII